MKNSKFEILNPKQVRNNTFKTQNRFNDLNFGSLILISISILVFSVLLVGCTPTKNNSAVTEKKVLFYRNPMNSSITSPVPMKDEMGMEYIPVYENKSAMENGVSISAEQQRQIGVETGNAAMRNLNKEINTVGTIAYDPDLFIAQEEFISAIKLNDEGLVSASKNRLKLLGMSDSQIIGLEKDMEGESSLILPKESALVYAAIYEYELGLAKEGLSAIVDTPAYPGETFSGKIVSIPEVLDPNSRSVKARIQVENPAKKLKPGMYVNMKIIVPIGNKLSIPEEAVINTGERSIVVISDGKGNFQSRDIQVGQKAEGYYEVISGLDKNDKVVTSGNFLIDSESRLKSVVKSEHKHGGN